MKWIFAIVLSAAVAALADGVTNVVTNEKGVTNSFTRGGVAFARRGALTSSDFVVTNAETVAEGLIAATVTNVVRNVQGLVYDETQGITWRQVMHDGNLYYVAVTNANITEVQ